MPAPRGFLPEDKNFATRAITTRFDPTQWESLCVTTPIVMSTTFQQPAPAQPKVPTKLLFAKNKFFT